MFRNRTFLYSLPLFVLLVVLAPVLARAQYCTSNATSTADTEIDRVQLNGNTTNINTNTTNQCATYTNFTATQSADVSPGCTYQIGIQLGSCSGFYYTRSARVFVDWNKDFDFTDPGEDVLVTNVYPGSASPLDFFPFTVPSNAAAGTTRLRVVCIETSSPTTISPCGTYTWGETEDYTLNVSASGIDLGITSITNPNTSCGLTSNQTLQFEVRNLGPSAIAGGSVTANVTVNGNPVGSMNLGAAGSIASGATYLATFPTGLNLATPGTYVICVNISLPGDVNACNDNLCKTVESIPTVTSYPYAQDFESGVGGWLPSGTLSSWAHGTPAKNVIVGAATGTKCYVTGGLGTTLYNSNEHSFLQGPCFNFTSIPNPVIQFDVWWEIQETADGAILQSSIDGGLTWQRVGSLSSGGTNWYQTTSISSNPGQVAGASPYPGWSGNDGIGSNGWVQAKHDLTGLGGQPNVLLRFAFRADNSSFSLDDGIAIDNIAIFQKQNNDVAAITVTKPTSRCAMKNNEKVTVRLKNEGVLALTNITVGFSVDGGPYQTEVYAGPLAPGATFDYQLTTKFANLSVPGVHSIRALAKHPLDVVNTFNDTAAAFEVIHVPTVSSFPYFTDFESGPVNWSTGTISGSNNSWRLSDPAGFIVSGPYSGLVSWNTANPTYKSSEASFVASPCFNFSALQNPVVGFYANWYSFNEASGTVMQYSLDTGTTWQRVGNIGTGNNWYTSTNITAQPGGQPQGWEGLTGSGSPGSWVNARNYLTALAGAPLVQFRFALGTTSSTSLYDGFGFDDFTIKEGPVIDLGPDTLICAGDSVILDAGPGFVSYFWTTLSTSQSIVAQFPDQYVVKGIDAAGFEAGDTIKISFSEPDANLGPDQEVCQGNSLTLSVPNQTGATYQWSTGATGNSVVLNGPTQLVTVTVTDSLGCQAIDQANVVFHPLPFVDFGPTTTFCAGGNQLLDAAVGNPVPNCSYLWSNGSTSEALYVSAPGTYWVQATSPEGCSTSDTVTVSVLPAPSVNLGNDVFQCSNVNVLLNALNSGSNYQWSTGATSQTITVTQTGLYWVEVTNSLGCKDRDSIVIGATANPLVNLPPSINSCGPATLDAGSDPVSYLWSTGQTTQSIVVTQSGLYTIVATDQFNCVSVVNTNVTVNPAQNTNFWSFDTAYVGQPTTFVDASFPIPGQWSWSFGDGNTSNQQSPTHTYQAPGQYLVTLNVTDPNGCTGTHSFTITVAEPLGTLPGLGLAQFMAYPNPTNGWVTVQAQLPTASPLQVRVLSLSGQRLLEAQFDAATSFQAPVDLSSLSAGVYLLEVSAAGQRQHLKLMKN